jgi:hypothetical protein
MSADYTWQLESVSLCDLLGYQGTQDFKFSSGLQVLEAPNHTGKSSLVLSLLWGLTGELPVLSRVDNRSFRLTNKHAGANATPRIHISLLSSNGSRMEIRRKYIKGGSTDGLEVSLATLELEGDEAAQRIASELGIKSSTLQGCGVVLQEHRLKLVTGTEPEISDVINDMLGLQALSQVVPCLQKMSGEGERLKKDIAAFLLAADPVARWEGEDRRLRENYRTLENAAVAGGVEPAQLDDPALTAAMELAGVAEELNSEKFVLETAPRSEVVRLRALLSRRRKESGESEQLSEVRKSLTEKKKVAKAMQEQITTWEQQDALILKEQSIGEMDRKTLAAQIADAELVILHCSQSLKTVKGEKELLAIAYNHVLDDDSGDTCPICESQIEIEHLRARLKERIDIALADDMEALAERKKKASALCSSASERLTQLQGLYHSHDRACETLRELCKDLPDAANSLVAQSTSESLFADSGPRLALIEWFAEIAAKVEAASSILRDAEAQLQEKLSDREDQHFNPIDTRINRVLDLIVPLLDSAQQMEKHSAIKESVNQREADLKAVSEKVREFAAQLKKIANAVSEDQKQSASQSIDARLPFISKFFASVACNPDYTGLTVETTVAKEKVAYRIRATSSKMAALTDFVGHVLSEGDLCAAGIALLLGLASGDSHRLGLLVLDDPGQGMDPELQKNFARELAALAHKPQVIVLTHQPDFAALLESEGCARRHMGRWEGGRLVEFT